MADGHNLQHHARERPTWVTRRGPNTMDWIFTSYPHDATSERIEDLLGAAPTDGGRAAP